MALDYTPHGAEIYASVSKVPVASTAQTVLMTVPIQVPGLHRMQVSGASAAGGPTATVIISWVDPNVGPSTATVSMPDVVIGPTRSATGALMMDVAGDSLLQVAVEDAGTDTVWWDAFTVRVGP